MRTRCAAVARRASSRALGVACATAAIVAPHLAHAEERPAFTIGARPIWYLLGGVTAGATLVSHERGFYAGGELSLVRLARGGRFFGFYGDGAYDFGARRTYAATGVEIGYKIIGADLGGALRLGDEHVEVGPTARLFVSVGIVSVYGRYTLFVDSVRSGDAHVVQVGALLKLPIRTWGVE